MRFIENFYTFEFWRWSSIDADSYFISQNILGKIIFFIATSLKILIGIFVASNITAIYIKVTIICAPVFILIIGIIFTKHSDRYNFFS